MKINNLFKIIFLLIIGLNYSCKKDLSLPSIQTNNPEIVNEYLTVLGGNITSNGGSGIIRRGVCWGTSNNPTIGSNNSVETYDNSIGNFSFNIEDKFEPNTFYYARAFCENELGIQYGNTVTFTTGQFITIQSPTDILTRSVKLKGFINQAANAEKAVGFVYSTSPNPNINNDKIEAGEIIGTSSFEVYFEGLLPKTTYYAKAYIFDYFKGYTYSNEISFKTVGYTGPAGGYVAYDKGEVKDGWRFLEIHPTQLAYNGSYDVNWSDLNNFISGTTDEFGKGQENTTFIVNNTTTNNCAAKLCNNLVLNGYSDWFLPSSNELLTIANSLQDADIEISAYTWTSTQRDISSAYMLYYTSYPSYSYSMSSYYTNFGRHVLPVRRY